jgi:hypothetical protein
VFGIASHAVQRAVPAVAMTLTREGGVLYADFDAHRYPAHELSDLTGLAPGTAPERRNLVVADSDNGPIGLLVDAILDAWRARDPPRRQISEAHSRRGRHRPLGRRQRDPAAGRRRTRAQPARAVDACRRRSARAGPRRAPLACLVVDDSLSVRRAIGSLLEDQGYEIVLARDGIEAVKAMEVARPTSCSPTWKCPT